MALLDDLEGRHSVITSSLHTRHHTHTARSLLSSILCIANVRKEMLITFSVITDFSYGWSAPRALRRRVSPSHQVAPGVGNVHVDAVDMRRQGFFVSPGRPWSWQCPCACG